MSNAIIETANTIRNKYSFEIDNTINVNEFLKAKFLLNMKYWKNIHNIIYKKLKK